MAEIQIRNSSFHYLWSRKHKVAAYARPGDRVTFEVNDVTSWQINRDSNAEIIRNLDRSKFYPLTGPVYVKGARPGDALVVNIEKVEPDDWGWTAIMPGGGLLEEYTEPFLWIWKLNNRRYTMFKNGIRIPLRPFCGVMGVAPPSDNCLEVTPPNTHGGNMDTKYLTVGSRLMLPVWVDGALFSVGDLHAAQGDGEVCVTAIECPGRVTVRLDVERGGGGAMPRYITKGEPQPQSGFYVCLGISSDLMDASKNALRSLIEYLARYGLTREEAYVLCSVAADLRIHEVVNKPNWVVGAMISRDLLPTRPSA